jgi:hypothetical protein
MDHNLRDEKITVFVRDVLGCGCPDEVFDKIEVSVVNLEPDIFAVTRIVVGDTLLIYLLPNIILRTISDNIGSLVVAGKHDRDNNNYNRFRLVVPSGIKAMEGQINEAFIDAAKGDEKLHLHFVAADALPIPISSAT